MKRLPTFAPPWLTVLPSTLLAALLSACGGGASSPASGTPPDPTATPVTCTLALQYADGGSSGIAIAPQALSANRYVGNCKLSQLQGATLTVCVDHPNRSELTGELLLSGTAVTQFQLANGVLRGSSCLSTSTASTALLEFTSTQPATAGQSPTGAPWSLRLTDTVQNNLNGHLVAWALELKGLP